MGAPYRIPSSSRGPRRGRTVSLPLEGTVAPRWLHPTKIEEEEEEEEEEHFPSQNWGEIRSVTEGRGG